MEGLVTYAEDQCKTRILQMMQRIFRVPPKGSPMGQHYCQSGNIIIVGSLPMNHWTWLDEGPASNV